MKFVVVFFCLLHRLTVFCVIIPSFTLHRCDTSTEKCVIKHKISNFIKIDTQKTLRYGKKTLPLEHLIV